MEPVSKTSKLRCINCYGIFEGTARDNIGHNNEGWENGKTIECPRCECDQYIYNEDGKVVIELVL